MPGFAAEEFAIDLDRRFLRIDQPVRIVLAAAAGGRYPQSGAAGGDLLVLFAEGGDDGIEMFEVDVDYLNRLPHRQMYELAAVRLGHLGDLLQPGNRHPSPRHPQAHGEQVLAAFLDEAAGFEVFQINGGFPILFRHIYS